MSYDAHIPPHEFNTVVNLLRSFFMKKGYIETHTQSRVSILAACEDPHNLGVFKYIDGQYYPLPQTGQKWLEHDLLKDVTNAPGFFCVSTSYRFEQNPIPGRHNTVFPMFEFEGKGSFGDMVTLWYELLSYLGFTHITYQTYEAVCSFYGIDIINSDIENLLTSTNRSACLLCAFPERSNPFWNMKREHGYAQKCDIIIHGMECAGSAERSTDKQEMIHNFYTIEGGRYAETLFNTFGKDRVLKELDEFLMLPFVPRFGAGIGLTRLIQAMKVAQKHGLKP